MARGWCGHFSEARALIIDENGRHALVRAAQLLPFQFSRRAPQLLLSAPFVRNGRDALVADERATLAAAGRLRLAKQRRNGVYFVGRDLRHDAEQCIALHAAHLLAEKIFSTPTCFPLFAYLRGLRIGDCHLASAVAYGVCRVAQLPLASVIVYWVYRAGAIAYLPKSLPKL
jgi:hypothetical protein